ncbi:MFS transporter [Halosimplex marinum]|uniref:MFS transporter n=1 Tax=Halosimplex marinum TaxID=3396620 RepID=UPI003F5679C4
MASTRRYQALFFVFYAAFSGFVAFRSVYLQEIGMTGTQIGLVGSLWVAGGVVAQPAWGLVADYTQSPTRVLFAAALASGVAILSYPLSASLPAHAFLVVAGGTLLFSMTRAPIVPIANSLVLRQGVEYGRVRSFGSIAFGVTVLVVGYAIARLETGVVVYLYVGGMVCFLALLRGVPQVEEQVFEGDLGAAAVSLVREPRFFALLATAFAMGLVSSPGAAFFSVYMRAVELGDGLTGVAWFLKTVVEAAVFLSIARWADSYGWPIVLGGVSYVAAFGLLTTWASLPSVLLANAFLGVGLAVLYFSLVNLAHESAPAGMDSTAQTLLTSVGIGAGGALGQSLAGRLVDLVGVQEMYAFLAGGALLVVAFGVTIHRFVATPGAASAA